MEYHRSQPPCSRFIASNDPRSKCVKCMGFRLHVRLFSASQNVNCENLHLKTLRSRLKVFERESPVSPCRAPEASAALCESTTWGLDVELEAMGSEQTGIVLSLPLSPEHVHANSPVEFTHGYLYPSPEANNAVFFGLDDVLFTAAFNSEDFGLF